jgi:pimeloyl-ACP methyl ester carboxylesterase
MAMARIIFLVVAMAAAPTMLNSQSVLVTSILDVDGVAVRVRSSLATRPDPQAPVVVFESGGGIPLETWDPILDKVAAFAPVLAYDRSGTGQTPWDGQPPTPQRTNQRLKKLLDTLKASSPIILVGHSWGGALARYFAGEYPQMVSAILYIDPTDVTMVEPQWQQMFKSFGASPKDLDAFLTAMEGTLKNAPPAVGAEASMILDLMRTKSVENLHLKPMPKIPASVLLASRVPPIPKGMVPFDSDAYGKALHSTRAERLRSWAHDGGRYTVVEGTGHFVHRDAPDVVITEIQSLIVNRRR